MSVEYPYIPEDRFFRFVSETNPFMIEARKAQAQCSGDPLFPVGAVLVKSGEVIARAGNGYNRGPGEPHICPRILQNCPSGTGYDLCDLHSAPGHAESMVIKDARDREIEPTEADVYLYGHWWCCQPCWNVMIDAGVGDVYLLENAHIVFSREAVYRETLKSYPPDIVERFFCS
jgi:deoxycytidylate deaminase